MSGEEKTGRGLENRTHDLTEDDWKKILSFNWHQKTRSALEQIRAKQTNPKPLMPTFPYTIVDAINNRMRKEKLLYRVMRVSRYQRHRSWWPFEIRMYKEVGSGD